MMIENISQALENYDNLSTEEKTAVTVVYLMIGREIVTHLMQNETTSETFKDDLTKWFIKFAMQHIDLFENNVAVNTLFSTDKEMPDPMMIQLKAALNMAALSAATT